MILFHLLLLLFCALLTGYSPFIFYSSLTSVVGTNIANSGEHETSASTNMSTVYFWITLYLTLCNSNNGENKDVQVQIPWFAFGSQFEKLLISCILPACSMK